MQFTEHTASSAPSVSRYRDGLIEIGDAAYTSPVLLTENAVIAMPSENGQTAGLPDEQLFAALFEQYGRPELLILGTGAKQQFVHPKTAAFLAAQQVGIECMNTASAARTLMILQSEGRRIWAYLLP